MADLFIDPAAEEFHYPVTLDIRELITVEDVMEELNLGPNGCVVFVKDLRLPVQAVRLHMKALSLQIYLTWPLWSKYD